MGAKKTPDERLGCLLREVREQAGFTQVQLAERLNIHQASVSYIELGKNFPSWPTIQAWLNACNLSEEAPDFAILFQSVLSRDGSLLHRLARAIPKMSPEIKENLFQVTAPYV